MLTAIREIGRWLRQKRRIDELSTLIQSPFPEGYVILLKVNLDHNKFDGVELEQYDATKVNRYLYRKGESNGPNPSPAARITEVEKTFSKKILAWFNKYKNLDTEGDLLAQIENILTQHQDEIIKKTGEILGTIDKNANKLLTIKIKKDNSWYYPGDLEVFRTLLTEIVNTQTKEVAADNQVCSICGERKKVSGDPRVFKFYTIDKPGFIAGGFNKSLAWKNFPLCYKCKLEIEEGRRFIEENLSFNFCGLNYFLIPRLLLTNIQPEIMEILLDSRRVVSLQETVKRRITEDNREILDCVAREKDVITVNFLFLKKEKSAERILLLIEDIFPSRIKEIFEAKDEVDRRFPRADGNGFTFRKIRQFFARSSEKKQNYDLDNYFLEIVDSTFRGKRLDLAFLCRFYMAVIRSEFIKEEHFKPLVDDALMGLMFFRRLGLISFQEVNDMEQTIFDDVFGRFAEMFNNPAARGVFLLGALTQLLLNKQRRERGAAPFRKYLKGLRMRESDIRGLFPKVRNKLEEYDSFDRGKAQIATEITKYLLAASKGRKMSTDEINFYFACGMSLAGDIARIVYKEEPNKEEV